MPSSTSKPVLVLACFCFCFFFFIIFHDFVGLAMRQLTHSLTVSVDAAVECDGAAAA